MKRYAMVLGAIMVAGALSLQAADKKDEEDDKKGKEAAKPVISIAQTLSKKDDWEALSKEGKALSEKHSLEHVMRTMKLRKDMALKSGLGIGAKPGAVSPDGIEAMFTQNIGKWKTLPANWSTVKADYIKAADVISAVATISIHQCPNQKKMGDKDPEMWKVWTIDMYKSSRELAKAFDQAKGPNDLPAIKAAAAKLTRSCNECHTPYRGE